MVQYMKTSNKIKNMATHLTIPVSKWAAIGGAVLVGWQIFGKADEALIKHLDATFATKQDIQRIEDKLDQVLIHQISPHAKPPTR